MGEVLHGSLLQLLLEHCDFLNIYISQGSVATRLRCGEIFKHELVANLPMSLPVKEFWKSVNISGSYGQEFGVLFFSETQCTLVRIIAYENHCWKRRCHRRIAQVLNQSKKKLSIDEENCWNLADSVDECQQLISICDVCVGIRNNWKSTTTDR